MVKLSKKELANLLEDQLKLYKIWMLFDSCLDERMLLAAIYTILKNE